MQPNTPVAAAVLAATAVFAVLLGAAVCVPHPEAEEMTPSLELTVAAMLPVGAARGGGVPEAERGQVLELLAGALASRLSEALHRGRHGCGGNYTAAALEAAMKALLPPEAEDAGWTQEAAPTGWRRLVTHRLVRLSPPPADGRLFFDDIDLSYQSIITLIVEMFASMVGLGWGAFSTFASG
ncbi:uncharacterized protein LOC126100689 [Schistocerca cancellata]|uniref:uncharacterized protein LOC126100689 n=1 Tax=Schistocerca cancellata TaxID=274614 RepID=UPI0021178339|nr:uncharacterized protein LOC126100689 [Schistocerca cancellata]